MLQRQQSVTSERRCAAAARLDGRERTDVGNLRIGQRHADDRLNAGAQSFTGVLFNQAVEGGHRPVSANYLRIDQVQRGKRRAAERADVRDRRLAQIQLISVQL